MSIDCIPTTLVNSPVFGSFHVQPLLLAQGPLRQMRAGTYAFAATFRNPQTGWNTFPQWQSMQQPAGQADPVHFKESFLSEQLLVHISQPWNAIKVTFNPTTQDNRIEENAMFPNGRYLAFYMCDHDADHTVWIPILPFHRAYMNRKQAIVITMKKKENQPALGNIKVNNCNEAPRLWGSYYSNVLVVEPKK